MKAKLLPTILDTKYNSILAEERSLAKAVAEEVIGVNTVGVWDIVIPVFFVMNIIKSKRAKEGFILNLLFTKKLALEAAYNMIDKEITRDNALAAIDDKTSRVLSSDRKGVYSEKVRLRQMKEIALLLDHYSKLINADGKKYEIMVNNAYGTKKRYLEFLDQLKRAEKDVNYAALQTVGNNASAKDFVFKMEKAVQSIRAASADIFFSDDPETLSSN